MKNLHLQHTHRVWAKTLASRYLTLLIVLFITSTTRAQQDCPLVDRIDNLMDINTTGGTTGFYLKKVGGSIIASTNSNTIFEPASAVKVLFHAHAMRQVQVNNSLSLANNLLWERDLADDRTGARPRFPGFCTPTTPDLEIDDLQTILRGMMEQSDNRHTQAVRNFFGDNQIMATANTLGLSNTDLNHNIGCVCNNLLYNEVTLQDLGKIYEGVATGFLNEVNRQTFYDLMLTEINGMGTTVRSIVDNENITIGLSASQINDFKSQIRMAYKGGSYGCGPTLWRSNAGWVQLPFKSTTGSTVQQQYVFGSFANAVSSINTNISNISAELLRDEIRAALQTWASQSQSITLKSSYEAGQVGTFIGNEFPLLQNVVDVVSLSSTRAVVAVRTEAGKLKLIAFDITNNGATITRKGSYTTGVSINQVKAVKLSSSRLATAFRASNGELWVSAWDVNLPGSISHAGSQTAGTVNDLDILMLHSGRVVTPVSTTDVNLKVIVWDISSAGSVSRKGEGTVSSANLVVGDRLSSTRFVTAVRDVSFGNLKLQSWDVTSIGNVVLRDTESAGAVTDIDITSLSSVRFVTSVQQGNLLHKSISWEVCASDGKIRRVNDRSLNINIAETSSSKLGFTRLAVANRRWGSNTLDMSIWDIGTGSYLVRSAWRLSEQVGQVKTSNLYYSTATQRYLTAYTNASGNLKLAVWEVGLPQNRILNNKEAYTTTQVGGNLADEIDTDSALGQSFPNPAKIDVTIPFEVQQEGLVEIKLLDIQGKTVKPILNKTKEKGKHTVTVDLSALPGGTYFYKMTTRNSTITKKMILVD